MAAPGPASAAARPVPPGDGVPGRQGPLPPAAQHPARGGRLL